VSDSHSKATRNRRLMDRRFRNEASTRVDVTRKYSILIRIRLTTSRYEDKGAIADVRYRLCRSR